MERLTRPLDNYPCRIKECYAEDWMMNLYDNEYPPSSTEMCDSCPFMAIVNRLAEYEDSEEVMEDDLK